MQITLREKDMAENTLTGVLEIVDGLLACPARISPKYFYDARGSALFEEITRLPEYYPTRTEQAIMAQYAHEIAARIGPGRTVIEPGAGNCEKARRLCALIQPDSFVAVDISSDFLQEAVAGMQADFPALTIRAVAADLTADLVLPEQVSWKRRLVFYPGSSIGNFDAPHACSLLAQMYGLLENDGALLIGVDLSKDIAVLEAAYDDAAGVTAAFNLNILNHVNRLLGSDFVTTQWRHKAFFNQRESRIEMHLEALAETVVRWPGGERRFACGERIHTENSYKYQINDFIALLGRAGFHQTTVWTDPQQWFAVVLARA